MPGLVEDLACVEHRGPDGAGVTLLAGGANTPDGVVGGKVCWYYGPVAVSERVIDRDVNGNTGDTRDKEYSKQSK